MVDYNNDASKKLNVSTDVKLQVKEIMGKKGNSDKIDHHQEYEELKILLSGQKDDNKEFIEGFMIEYEDQYKTSEKIREKVLHYVGTDKKADDKNEKKALKNLMDDTNNDFDKEYIKRVIDGKEAVDAEPDNETGVLPSENDNKGNAKETNEPNLKNTLKELPKSENPKLKKEPKEKTLIVPFIPPVQNNNQDNSVKVNEPIQGVTQDGEVNVIADDGATVIINTGNNTDKTNGINGEEVPAGETNEPKKLSPEEMAKARALGHQVSELLTNDFTNRNEQITVSNIINEQVNSDNVLEFLKGYEKQRKSGDHFFTQMLTEYSFKEKETLMRKVATDLMKKLENEGCTADAEEIAVILAKGSFTKQDAFELDKIVKLYLEN